MVKAADLSAAKPSERTDRETDRNDEDRVVLVSSSCLSPGRLLRRVRENRQRYSNTKDGNL